MWSVDKPSLIMLFWTRGVYLFSCQHRALKPSKPLSMHPILSTASHLCSARNSQHKTLRNRDNFSGTEKIVYKQDEPKNSEFSVIVVGACIGPVVGSGMLADFFLLEYIQYYILEFADFENLRFASFFKDNHVLSNKYTEGENIRVTLPVSIGRCSSIDSPAETR